MVVCLISALIGNGRAEMIQPISRSGLNNRILLPIQGKALTKFRGSSDGFVNTDRLHLSRYLTPVLKRVSLSREKFLLAPLCLSVFCSLVFALFLLEEIQRNLIFGTFMKTCRETPHFVEIRQKCRANQTKTQVRLHSSEQY